MLSADGDFVQIEGSTHFIDQDLGETHCIEHSRRKHSLGGMLMRRRMHRIA